VQGVDELRGAEHTAVPDRIEVGTWAAAAVATLGDVTIGNARPEHLELLLAKLADAGAQIELPSSALLERDGKTFVWVVDAATRKVSIREVKIGARDADSFRVAEGLAAGTRVVTAGVHSLLPDQVVKIQDTHL